MWDNLIAGSIIVGLILTVWAKVSNQTIPELLGGIKDIILPEQVEGVEVYE